jgi:hypothetical protein
MRSLFKKNSFKFCSCKTSANEYTRNHCTKYLFIVSGKLCFVKQRAETLHASGPFRLAQHGDYTILGALSGRPVWVQS